MKEEKSSNPNEALGTALQWACSPRGGNNFYGRVLNGCSRIEKPGLNTLGVSMSREGKYYLAWDPAWFVAIPKPFQLMAIIHEAGHLVLQHLERILRIHQDLNDLEKSRRIRPVIQIAADMAVNDTALRPLLTDINFQFIQFKNMIIWPEQKSYPKDKTFEEYLALLLKDLKQNGWSPNTTNTPGDKDSSGSAAGSEQPQNPEEFPQWFQDLLDINKLQSVNWDEMISEMSEAEIERALTRSHQEAQRIVKSAIEQTKKCRGTIPGNMQEAIQELLEEPVIPWQEVLRGLLKSELSHKLDESTACPNPAFMVLDDIEPYPGYQRDYAFKVLACFDTSGSMSTTDFKDCCKELLGFMESEEGVQIRLLQFDAAIQREEDLDPDNIDEYRRLFYRYGHGGTSFSPVLKYALGIADPDSDWTSDAKKEEGTFTSPDLMLIFTDGEAPIPLPELDPQIPLLWILTAHGREDPRMDLVVSMK